MVLPSEETRASGGLVALMHSPDELAAHERLRLQFELMPIACMILDPQGRVIDWNPAAERIFGYGRGELLGKDGWILVPATSRPFTRVDMARRASSSTFCARRIFPTPTPDTWD